MAVAHTPPTNWDRRAAQVKPPRASRLLERFVVAEIVCQLALLSGTLARFRTFFCTAVFAFSLGLLFLLPGHGRPHPVARLAFFILALLALEMDNTPEV